MTLEISLAGYRLTVENGYWRIRPPLINPVEALLQEIEKALDAQLYYLGLLLTLTLPSICAALEAPGGRPQGRDRDVYKTWYQANIFDLIGGLSADEAWELRCTVVHQSHALASKKRGYDRIIFTMRSGPLTVDSMILEGMRERDETARALTFDVAAFCERWIGQARLWIERSKSNHAVQSNLPNLLQVRPDGLSPFIVGIPIIA
ncbi:hypothetical protein NML43_00110 [Rhodopseudomonas palustris]|uniref:hypothetical protein n=1 Tax=Rhodopseudomonas palustris TaxID=1076 RepID=UPI0020CE3060|nr:hypothetical protein [Rhodopseudomonas palustris]MCP9625478.1 hypothetical protein [Rhodopseudomonas palustris]